MMIPSCENGVIMSSIQTKVTFNSGDFHIEWEAGKLTRNEPYYQKEAVKKTMKGFKCKIELFLRTLSFASEASESTKIGSYMSAMKTGNRTKFMMQNTVPNDIDFIKNNFEFVTVHDEISLGPKTSYFYYTPTHCVFSFLEEQVAPVPSSLDELFVETILPDLPDSSSVNDQLDELAKLVMPDEENDDDDPELKRMKLDVMQIDPRDVEIARLRHIIDTLRATLAALYNESAY